MKYQTHILIPFSLLVLSLASCSEAEKSAPLQAMASDSTAHPHVKDSLIKDSLGLQKPTETFRGTYNDKEVLFSHKDFQTYTLSTGGELASGKLNTERGYGDDHDATVYVLNSDKPKSEQKCFVRTSAGSIYMLDQDRYVVDDAFFDPATAAAVKPVAANKPKPAVAEVTKKEPALKKRVHKHSHKKTLSKKDTVKAPDTLKKTPAKKISKPVKKKKPVRKARKKSRRKKAVHKSDKKQESPKSDKQAQ